MKQLKPRRVGAGDEEAAAGVVVPLTPRKDYCCLSWSSWCLLRALTLLLVLLTGVLIGFGASANISRYYYYTLLTGTGTGTSSSSPPSLISSNSPTPPSTLAMSWEQHISQPFMSFVHPGSPEGHSMTDAELFWRASMVQRVEEYPYQRVPKVAFLFLTRGPLPFARLWERFFRGHEGLYSVYVHALPEYVLNVSATSPFYGRQIPSRDVSWGSITLVTEFFDYDYHRIYTQRL